MATRESIIEKAKYCLSESTNAGVDFITYVNATFYPKMVADVTTGTETTAQTLYNPLPVCKPCGC